jgi:hypothetical protein
MFCKARFLIALLMLPLALGAQNPDSIRFAEIMTPWYGHWKGELHVYQSIGKFSAEKMHLIISPCDTLFTARWILQYGDSAADSRNYLVKALDLKKDIFIIDEQNSILLDLFYRENIFISAFRVGDNTLLVTYRLLDENIAFEIAAYNTSYKNTSGGTNENIPKVESYPISIFQKAVLKKMH